MVYEDSILRTEEKAVFLLRQLYHKAGYLPFKMSKFEEYDLYSKNKDFLVSEGVITFNDTTGRLLALKPDVTLSIIKNHRDGQGQIDRFYYNENVYRIADGSHTYKEIMQTGLECMGNIGQDEVAEVALLACQSLAALCPHFVLSFSHMGLVGELLRAYDIPQDKAFFTALKEKNPSALCSGLNEMQRRVCLALLQSYACPEEAFDALKAYATTEAAKDALSELGALCDRLRAAGYGEALTFDCSIISATGYYSGILFQGFIPGVASRVLSGGRYDGLMARMGKSSGAVGFAVYLDLLERAEAVEADDGYINVALPKGRLGEKVYAMFEAAGYECPAIREQNRKLIFENAEKKIRYFWVKPSDVAIYVERGAADIGVAGKDILLEYEPDVYELLDLGLGKCRMAVAAKKDFKDDPSKTLRVATKFSRIARRYYAEQCRDIDIIHLNGSIEIAPILGLSDVIVDIVETGKTLAENDLAAFQTILPISARLIANKASYSFKTEKIEQIKQQLGKQVKEA